MKPSDLRDHEHGSRISADVCIIGSGPAGATIALELADTGIDVVMLESGGDKLEPDTNALYNIDNVGLPRIPQDDIRVRQFGGTSTLWTGRCSPFREVDYEARPWIPHSGWPFDAATMAPYLGRAARYLGLAAMEYDRHAWSAFTGKPPTSKLNPADVVDQLWQFSAGQDQREPVRINVDYADRLAQATNIRTILHANVLEIVPNPGGRQVDHVVVSTLEGKSATVTATTVVVCAGGIESARLLLASRSVTPAGLGNDRDLVGRFYAEHPYGEVGEFDLSDDMVALLSRFGLYWHDNRRGRNVFISGFALSPRVQRELELLNCCMYILPEESEDTAVHAARRLAHGEGYAMHDARTLLGSPMELAQAAKRRKIDGLPPIPPPDRVFIGVNAEQVPDRDSRIMLSDQTDALGMPLSRVDWRMDDRELSTIQTMFELVCKELARNHLPVPKAHPWLAADDWRSSFVDTAHHSCSVRMGSDPSTGVTDAWGHVYGVDGLFVAGGALFPTVGTANPTLMLTGVAVKVADAVRLRHEVSTSVPVGTTARERCRVGLVGSGHRMETVYLPALAALSDNLEIVGFTSRTPERRESFSTLCGAPGFEDADALVERGKPDLLLVAVADDANESMTRHLLGTGIPMLVETPWSWSTRRGRDLLGAVSAEAVIGVAEQFPFLPLEQLRSRLIGDGVLGPIQAVHNESATWDYHGIAQLRRYIGPMSQPKSVQATAFTLHLSDANDISPRARNGYSATVLFSDDIVMSQRFINFYDQPLRFNQGVTIDGQLGSMVDSEVRYIDRLSGEVTTAHVERTCEGDRLMKLSIDLGALGELSWNNPFAHASLDDEQIAVATHISAMVGATKGDASPLYSPSSALADVEIMHAIKMSAASGRSMTLPLNVYLEKVREATSPAFLKAGTAKVSRKIRATLRR